MNEQPPSPTADSIRVERVSVEKFPHDEAVLFEGCFWRHAKDMSNQLDPRTAICLIARSLRRDISDTIDLDALAHEISRPEQTESPLALRGFLIAGLERVRDTARYRCDLFDIVTSLIDDRKEDVEDALVRGWQAECHRNAWLELIVDVHAEGPDDPIFTRHSFERRSHAHPLTVDHMVWRPSLRG